MVAAGTVDTGGKARGPAARDQYARGMQQASDSGGGHLAHSGSDTFSIQFANDNSANGLDNFSVAGAGAVPELSTRVMSLFGFAGLGLLARTGRRAPSRFGR
jgi:hypothetical protein